MRLIYAQFSNVQQQSVTPQGAAAELLQRRVEQRELGAFVRQAWPILEPASPFLSNWHIDAIVDYLEAVTRGEVLRLLINAPPRHGKSNLISVLWPVWEWISFPGTRWLFGSYSASLAVKHSIDRRTLIQSGWFQTRWGNIIQLRDDQNQKAEFGNEARGVMVATGTGGTAIGKGGNRVIIDDPHDPNEVESDKVRESVKLAVRRKFFTRLDDPKRGAIIVTAQRLHQDDVSALCLDLGFTHLNFPAEAPHAMRLQLPSGRVFERAEGELLWPAREGPLQIAQRKRELGAYAFAGQYNQQPAPMGGGLLPRHWWRFWVPPGQVRLPPVRVRLANGAFTECVQIELPATFDHVLQSWDMAFKDKATNDRVAGQVWGRIGADKFLLEAILEHLSFTESLRAVRRFSRDWPATSEVLIEDRANGPAVIDALRHEIEGLIAVEPEGGKFARIVAVSPQIESGNVYLPHPALHSWVEDFLHRAALFPNVSIDDDLDALSQALRRLKDANGVSFSRRYDLR